MKKSGLEFEKLAEAIFNKLVRNPDYEKVEHNVDIKGVDGPRQIDVIIKSETAGGQVSTIIECKDHNRKISVGVLDAFHSKLIDVKANKGIIISKKGFSSQAISKAKRYGIGLCTAHEALKDSWNPDNNIPLLIREIKPVKLEFDLVVSFKDGDEMNNSVSPVINGFNIEDLIKKKWKDNEIEFSDTSGPQEIKLPELHEPLEILIGRDESTKRLIKRFRVFLTLDLRYFIMNLGDVKGTQILDNVLEGKKSIFLDTFEIQDFKSTLKPVSKSKTIAFRGMEIDVNVTPNIDLIQGYRYARKIKEK